MLRKRLPMTRDMYSPGGCGCALLVLPAVAVGVGVMLALAGLAVGAVVLLAAAIGISIWLYRTRAQRQTAGKSNVGWTIFLVISYLLSIGYLVFFVLLLVSSFAGESVTVG